MAPTARFPWCFPHGSELLLFSARSCPKSLRTFRDPALGDRSDAEQLPFMRVGEQAAGGDEADSGGERGDGERLGPAATGFWSASGACSTTAPMR
jgi:hypothetical protein